MTDSLKKAAAEKAAVIVYGNEGNYGSVNANDNGAVSVGKVQWHGSRALDLLKNIIKALGQQSATVILGTDFYNEIRTAIQWNSRIVTAIEKSKLTAILTTPAGKAAQDALAEKDILSYIEHGAGMGIEDAKALVYFADMENQGGPGASARVAKAAAAQAGTMSKVNLSILHNAALADRVMGRYATRRKETYSKVATLTFSSGDSNTNKTQTGGKEAMATMISNSGHDENGKYSGGQAGDNNDTEWAIIPWYNRPWNCILRHPDPAVRKLIAELAVEAANNNHIGYDQYQRETFWEQLQKVGYHPSKITVNCEADCSAGVCAIVKAVGHLTGNSKLQQHSATYTGNMKQGLKAAGFEVLTESKYLTSGDYLLAGDILLNERAHTATAVTNGVKAGAGNDSQTSNNSAYKVGDVVEFTGTKHYASSNDTSAKTCKPGKAKVTAVYNGKHPYHLVAEKNGDSTVYGWVDAADIKTKGSYKVGDVVEFTGTKHYASSNDTSAKTCKPGKAKVTAVYNGKHPYHLVAEKNGGSTVYGWVDAADIE